MLTITALFDDYTDAAAAVRELEAAGLPPSDIAIVANDAHGRHAAGKAAHVGQEAEVGLEVGATVGGVGGLLAGLGLLAIPGLGPVVAAGWLAATIVGAVGGGVIGAAAGGLVGALTSAGVSEEDAHAYAEGVRRGGTLVTVRVADPMASSTRDILTTRQSVDMAARRAAYRQEGWLRFDESSPIYNADQVSAEQARYRRM